jgi:GNAT superfamily N-acetyltransferase
LSAIIRSATLDDSERIHRIHTTAVRTLCSPQYAVEVVDGWLENRSPQGYQRSIESGAMFVAELEGQTAGFGEATVGEVVAVFVDPAFGGRGIGRVLLEHALGLARAGGRGSVRLESTLNAVGFYERFGFRVVEHTAVRRNRVEVPVVVMECSATEPPR